MPRLSELTDFEVPQPEEIPANIPRVYVNSPGIEDKKEEKSTIQKITDRLLGLNGEERYQLWPEKVIREGLTAAGDTMNGSSPQWAIDPATGDVHTSPQMIEKAQAISALAGTGGLGGVTDATLGATPFLRPALKYKDRLYKGKEGQSHQDVIPDALYPEFNKMAMSGEDISHYNFGFVNDKGHFMDRETALKYGIDTGIIDPQAGKFGALTSTLMADSSKPGTAIEAIGKTGGADPRHFKSPETATFRLGQLQRDKAASKKAGEDVNGSDYMFYNTQIRALKEYIKNPEEFNKSAKFKFTPVDHEPEFK